MNIDPSLNTWTSIFLVVAFHGIILAAVFFVRRQGKKQSNRLLGLFLLLFSLNLVGNVLHWSRYSLELPHLVGIAGTFHFLYGPILFFYTLGILNPDRKWKQWDLLHLVPLAVFIIWLLPFYLMPAEEKVGYMMARLSESAGNFELSDTALTIAGIKSFLLAGYAGAISFLLRKSQHQPKHISRETTGWLRVVSYDYWGYVICYISYFVLVETIDFQVEYDYMISFAMSLFIFGIGYLGLFKPNYLLEAHNGRFKYESSMLDPEQAEAYLERLLAYMDEEKPYLDGDLKMDDLAQQLSIPPHHLSQIINSRLEKNFFEFLNAYRVEEAKKMLADPDKKDFKILRVAFESGFNNKTTFNSAFKSEVGTTPSRFKKQRLNGG